MTSGPFSLSLSPLRSLGESLGIPPVGDNVSGRIVGAARQTRGVYTGRHRNDSTALTESRRLSAPLTDHSASHFLQLVSSKGLIPLT